MTPTENSKVTPEPDERRPLTGIEPTLTLPQLHLATFNKVHVNPGLVYSVFEQLRHEVEVENNTEQGLLFHPIQFLYFLQKIETMYKHYALKNHKAKNK